MGRPRLPENSALLVCALITVRLFSAMYNLIYDCDETFNYLEMSHWLIFKNGYVTWEYSPKFALRSYFYLILYIWPSYLLSYVISNELFLFYLTRVFIACLGVFSELYFCIGLTRCAGHSVARYCLAFLLMSSGMYFASTSFLPNTLSMHLTMITFGAWFCDHYQMTIFAAGLSILIGWPYAALAYAPIAIMMLVSRRKQLYFILFSLVYGLMILVPLTLVDSMIYGKLVIAPLNAILYNVFNTNGGPELYGVESFAYYYVNLLLNFNLVLIASICSVPMLILSKIFMTTRKHKMLESSHWICVATMLLWLFAFTIQAHKEERFMYPIYPLICSSAALTIKLIEQFVVVKTKRPYSSPVFKVIVYICCAAYLGLSLSRVISLHQGFKPTFSIFSDLKRFDQDIFKPKLDGGYINVCYGKEWYRYPGSYFLPSSKRYRLRFIQSDFRGQLPKLYDQHVDKTKFYDDFNDMNEEEVSRYISPDKCHYLIDSSQPNISLREPDYSKNSQTWKVLSRHKMLDLNRSPILIRSFYIPFVSEKQNSYSDYLLLRNNNLFTER